MTNLYIVFLIVSALYIWFDTSAFVDWAKLFRLKFLRYDDYLEARNSALGKITASSYPDFLAIKYKGNFFIKLITCPTCLAVWLNLISVFFLPRAISIGIDIVATWILYYFVHWYITFLNTSHE